MTGGDDTARGEYARRHQRISTAALLASLHAVADELGRTPTAREYDARSEHARTTLANRFDSWNAALDAAGLDRNAEYDIDEDRLIADLLRVEDELGTPPTKREYREHGRFAASTYQDRFGSWTTAIHAAGLDVSGYDWRGVPSHIRALADGMGGGPDGD